jgi:hypothetical protein
LRRHDGEYRWMISRAVPVRDSEGNIVRWFGTAVDIHDLYAASEARDLLAKELSHRIKNIFAVVSGLVSLSVRKRPEVQEFGTELIGMIQALGRAHDYVRPAEGSRRRSLHGILEDLFSPYGSGTGARVAVSGDNMNIAARSATPWRWCSTSWRPSRPSTARCRPRTARSTYRSPTTAARCCCGGSSAADPPAPQDPVQGLRLAPGRDERDRPARRLVGARGSRRTGMVCELTVSKAAIAP